MTFAIYPEYDITWTSGWEMLKKTEYSDIAFRTHCAACGSHLSMVYDCEPDLISMTMGTANEDSVKGELPKAKAHIFVGDGEKKRARWYELPKDGIPRFARFTDEFQEKLNEYVF